MSRPSGPNHRGSDSCEYPPGKLRLDCLESPDRVVAIPEKWFIFPNSPKTTFSITRALAEYRQLFSVAFCKLGAHLNPFHIGV